MSFRGIEKKGASLAILTISTRGRDHPLGTGQHGRKVNLAFFSLLMTFSGTPVRTSVPIILFDPNDLRSQGVTISGSRDLVTWKSVLALLDTTEKKSGLLLSIDERCQLSSH